MARSRLSAGSTGAYTPAVNPTQRAGAARVPTNPGDIQLMVAAVAVSVLLAALVVITLRRRQSERLHMARLLDREERLKLALWATGERYWDYDVASGKVSRLALDGQGEPGGRLDEEILAVGDLVHPDDLPMARERIAEYIAGQSESFVAELRIQRHGQWVVLFLRFSPFLRTMISLPAGLAHMKAWKFLLFTFVGAWTNFFWPFIVLGPSNPTLPVALQQLQAAHFVDYSLVLAGAVLATVPLLALFVLAGRQLVSGIMQGAVKQ